MKATQKPLVIAALVGLVISSLATLTGWSLIAEVLSWLSNSQNPSPALTALSLLSIAVVALGGIALVIMGFATKSLSSLRMPSLVFLFLGFGLWLVTPIPYALQSLQDVLQDPIFFLNAFYFPPNAPLLAIGVYLSAFSSVVLYLNANERSATRIESQPAQTIGETVSNPNYPSQPSQAPSSALPVLALVLAFFIPVVSIVLGHVALNQMNRGQIASDQRGLATAGLVLGYVFTVLTAIFIGIYAVLAFNLMSGSYGY
jgi:uncharacterized protein with PQ loop repeat